MMGCYLGYFVGTLLIGWTCATDITDNVPNIANNEKTKVIILRVIIF